MVLPLYRTDADIIIALEKPLEYEVLNQIRFLTSLRPVPVMASQEDLQKRIGESYARSHEPVMTFEPADDRDRGMEFSLAPKDSIEMTPATQRQAASRPGANASELASQLFAEDSALTLAPTEEEDIKDGDNVLVQVVNKMIVDASETGASDIHVETYPGRQNSRIRFRKDGVMRDYLQIPANFRAALISRIKIMASLDISERRKPQDGKIEFALSGGRKLELRLATIPTANGLEDAVMRLLAGSTAVPLDKLDMDVALHQRLKALADKSFGLILVCGPTGSGKTTSLHSLLAYMNTSERKIWTAEDPIEITQPGLRQVQMQHKIGWNFATALRAFMRADPDVIMVGEMRDTETAKVGVEASLTGHVVLSTLHTNSAAESVTRLLDLGLEPFSFADALLGVLAQRLVRKLCPECKQGHPADAVELDELSHEYCADSPLQPDTVRAGWEAHGPVTLYRPVGCKACEGTGYKGRTGLYELLLNGPAIRHLVQTRAPVSEILAAATTGGMQLLKQDGINKVLRGVTDVKQVRAVCN
jgi:type II secretory ATPase GspE/PulE/Tfp pilus assembly ATPase PilB-like protein